MTVLVSTSAGKPFVPWPYSFDPSATKSAIDVGATGIAAVAGPPAEDSTVFDSALKFTSGTFAMLLTYFWDSSTKFSAGPGKGGLKWRISPGGKGARIFSIVSVGTGGGRLDGGGALMFKITSVGTADGNLLGC